MENVEVLDCEEASFPIRVGDDNHVEIEMTYHEGVFILMSKDGYIPFSSISQIIKADENNYYLKQDEDVVTFTAEEYDMICKAVELCKGVKE